jgi:Transposase zinc-binding domain
MLHSAGPTSWPLSQSRCEDCGHERLIPFSCKGRGICPSCNTRRMAELAAHLTDHVLPHLAARQWVLSLPKRLRPFLHRDPDTAGAVLRIFLRAIRTTLRHASLVGGLRRFGVLPILLPEAACGNRNPHPRPSNHGVAPRVLPRSAMATPAKRVFRPPPSPARPTRQAVSPTYRPRRPKSTPLYPVVQHHLETFLARAAEVDPLGNGVPWWVEKDFRAYLRCGILAHGFARARCEDCGHERLIPFSCKGRGICPSCNTRRMAELAAHLTDHVLPRLAARQWVLSLPKRLRPFLHHDPDTAGAVLRIFLRAIRTTLRHVSPGAPADVQLGAVSFLHGIEYQSAKSR